MWGQTSASWHQHGQESDSGRGAVQHHHRGTGSVIYSPLKSDAAPRAAGVVVESLLSDCL